MRVENLGKRFGFEWIFRHLNAHFQPNKRYAIVGANGSGKSTLMKISSRHASAFRGQY